MKKKVFKKKKRSNLLKLKKRRCHFCINKTDHVDYKDVDLLKKFMTDRGKIIPRRSTGACAKHQRKLVRAIGKARNIALVP